VFTRVGFSKADTRRVWPPTFSVVSGKNFKKTRDVIYRINDPSVKDVELCFLSLYFSFSDLPESELNRYGSQTHSDS
jgi:hypothetical protein